MLNPKNRLISLDFFRGLTVAMMILANNPGSWRFIYPPLKHAAWHGCTLADLIFPSFLFIAGVAIVMAMDKQKENLPTHVPLIWKALKRMVILFSLGIFLSLYPKVFTSPIDAFKTVRIPGVLQRIAIVYFISTLSYLKLSPRSIVKLLLGMLLAYWILMRWIPVPGIGPANLEPTTNLGAFIDRLLLTEAHLWKAVKSWDPEGILSTLPAIATGLLGVLVGTLLKNKTISTRKTISWLLLIGILSIITGLSWGIVFPINKSLWTSSYTLYTGGIATLTLTLCYWIIDVKGYRKFTTPLVIYGSNAIMVFFVSGLLPRTLNLIKLTLPNGNSISLLPYLYQTYFTPYLSAYNASLAWSLMWIMIWLLILWPLYQRKIFIKV